MKKARVNRLITEIQEKVIKLSREIITLSDDLDNLDDVVNLKEPRGKKDD